MDLVFEVLDVITAEGLGSAAYEQSSAPLRLRLSVAAGPALKILAESDTRPRTHDSRRGERALIARSGRGLLQVSAGEDVDAGHPDPVPFRVYVPRRLLHHECGVAAGDACPALGIQLDVELRLGQRACQRSHPHRERA